MIESTEYNSQRTNDEDQQQQQQQQQQQHDGKRNRSTTNGKSDFRFLIPSRDAGGLFIS